MSINPVSCPKQPLARDIDVEVFINRPQTELATDMSMAAILTPDVDFSDGGNDRVRFYNKLDALLNDVPLNSAAYWAGQAFFSRSERPSSMCVGQIFENATPAVLRGGSILPQLLSGISKGGMGIAVDGQMMHLNGLDFTGVTKVSDIPAVLQPKLPGVIVSESKGALILKSSFVGDGASISYATPPTDIPGHVFLLKGNKWEVADSTGDGSFSVVFNDVTYTATDIDFSQGMTLAAQYAQNKLRLNGLTGVNVLFDQSASYLWLETESGTGFKPCPASATGTDLAPLIGWNAASTPDIVTFTEGAKDIPAQITSGANLDFSAIAALGTYDMVFNGVRYQTEFKDVKDLASLVSEINTKSVLDFISSYVASEDAGKLKIMPIEGSGGVSAMTPMQHPAGTDLKMTATTLTSIQPVFVPANAPDGTVDVSALLGLTESTALSNTYGYTPGNLVSEAAIIAAAAKCSGQSIYGWILDAKYRDTDEQKAFADWIEARDPAIFIACTNSPQAYNPASDSDIGAYCFLKGYRRTAVFYHNNPQVYPDMSYLACALSVNYALQDSSITLKFKQLDGIEPSPLTYTQLMALQARNINSYVFIGNTAREVREGTQALTTWFTDSLVNLDNFKEELQVEVYNVFLRTKKVPYTQAGQNMLVSAAAKICSRYTRNGVFAPRDIESLENETGFETLPSTNIQPAPITGATASDRAQRLAPPILITAYEAGAFHKVVLNVSVFN